MTRAVPDRAQTSPLGYALLVGLVLTGVVAIIAFGSAALTDTQGQSALARGEQTMTLFDSQAAQVALGESNVHTVDLAGNDGSYEVNPDAGSISIVQRDCDDNGTNDDGDDVPGDDPDASLTTDDDAYIMEPVALGSLTYTVDSTSLAYQGGGVWRQDREGDARMVSPPEFHYRDATLTLPVILTRGGGAASGPAASVRVIDAGEPIPVFQNRSAAFPERCEQEGTDEPFVNPVDDGDVFVRIESEYYRAWGAYFETRTDGNVTYYESEDAVEVALISLEQVGQFDMPGEGGSLSVTGASGGHATDSFSFTLRPSQLDSADFNNLQWSFYVDSGAKELEIHLTQGTGGGCPDTDLTVDLSIYYSDDGGNTYHGWVKEDAYEAQCKDLNGDGDEEIYVDIVLVDDDDGNGNPEEDDETDIEVDYRSLESDDTLTFNPNSGGATLADPTIDGHSGEADVTWEPETFTDGTSSGKILTTDRLINHYFAELPPEFELTVDDKNGNGGSVSESLSGGELFTGGSGRFVTFVHVTKNEVRVELTGGG